MMSSKNGKSFSQEDFDKINQKVCELNSIDKKDSAVFYNLRAEIIGLILQLEKYYYDKMSSRYNKTYLKEDVFASAYLDCIIECIKKYKSDKNSKFTTYFAQILNYRVIDILEKYKKDISLDSALVNEDGDVDSNLYDLIENKCSYESTASTDDIQTVDAYLNRYIMYIVELTESLNRNKKCALLSYYKLFYTARLVDLIKKEPSNNSVICQLLKFHEKEAIGCAEKGLIDFTYIEITDTIDEIFFNSLKRYNQLPYIEEKSKTDKVLDVPYRNKVLLAYLEDYYGRKVSDAIVSKMKKKFDSEICSLKNIW